MMKRFLIGLGVVVLAITGAVAYENAVQNNVEAKVQQLRENSNGSKFIRKEIVDVKDSNGFIVLDQKEKANHTTIVAKAVSADDFGFEMEDGEVIVQNVFDYADFVVLTKEEAKGVEIGSIQLVTFDGDNVKEVKKNDLFVANKVFGQKFNQELDVFTYVVTDIDGHNVYGNAISDYMKDNMGIFLYKHDDLNGDVEVGDNILVAFTKDTTDDIVSVEKIKK